ncbi:MAG: delta 1-pyrroline-5-carboxylate reductase [Thelocarpon impressellum]|nr:MAG: delta 1-pyrroline-5-carboxylate reductase [Thelocarpon impressellum]
MSSSLQLPLADGDEAGLTLTVLGCGTMGIAILSGILTSLSSLSAPPTPSRSGTSTPATEDLPPRLPSRFVACVRRPQSAARIKGALAAHAPALTILQSDNVRGARAADVVLLCCKPQMVADVLSGDEMKEALQGKLLISICAGVPVLQIEDILYPPSSGSTGATIRPDILPEEALPRCRIVRAMPNTASQIRESMTVISMPSPPLPPALASLTTWIFSRIGRVVELPPAAMDASTALCGSGPAFFALVLEAMADGAVAMGLPRAEAQLMAAQTMRGTAGLVLGGEHPALVREKVGTPGGCTIGGLLVLEEGRVRGTVARAVREATVVAGQLGRGVQGVNGTRF